MNNLLILLQQSNGKWESISIDDLLTLIVRKKLPISSDNGMNAVQNLMEGKMKLEEPMNDLEHNCPTCKYRFVSITEEPCKLCRKIKGGRPTMWEEPE